MVHQRRSSRLGKHATASLDRVPDHTHSAARRFAARFIGVRCRLWPGNEQGLPPRGHCGPATDSGEADASYAPQPTACIDLRTDFTWGWLSSKCLRKMARAFLKLAQAAARSPSGPGEAAGRSHGWSAARREPGAAQPVGAGVSFIDFSSRCLNRPGEAEEDACVRLSRDGPKVPPPRRGGRGIRVSCFHGLRWLADSLAPPVATGQRLSETRAGDDVGVKMSSRCMVMPSRYSARVVASR